MTMGLGLKRETKISGDLQDEMSLASCDISSRFLRL